MKLNNHFTVRGIYDYQAQGPDEMNVRAGEMIELSAGVGGGTNYGDGWWEGELFWPFYVTIRIMTIVSRRYCFRQEGYIPQ
jgi:hypothetical protein